MESYRDELINCIEHKAIPSEKIQQAVNVAKIHPSKDDWLAFINNLLLWVGSITLGLSCIFFIAHNWSEIGKLTKFAMVEGALIIAIIAYMKIKPNSAASNTTLILATLLLGALMALFGQTYQTGADPWQLFFNWALFITPWVLIARFANLWIIWLALLNLSLILYCDVNPSPLSVLFNSKNDALWLFFIFNTLSFITWYLLSPSFLWLNKQWAIRIIACTAGTSITTLALSAIVSENILSTMALPIWAVFFTAIYWLYRKITIDLFMLSGTCLSGLAVIMSLLGRELIDLNGSSGFLLLSILVIGLGMASAFWLKKVQMELNS
jgi:uncharacterized membrane protein